jgi:protein-S-isoprenylcysteine O-methyltransferase Ste14
MNNEDTSTRSSHPGELHLPRLLMQSTIRLGIGIVLLAVTLFVSLGSLDWPMAWVYLSLVILGMTVTTVLLARTHPDLLVERSHIGEGVKSWDRVLSRLMALGVLLPTLLIAGLDRRWGWSHAMPLHMEIGGAVLFALGTSWVSWAMVSNRFFAPVVRIQKDRGHTVATSGPYRFVRHPGYVGIMLCGVAVPLMLGSLWALVPAGLGVGVAVLRTALEDRTLRNELEGYKDYASRVRYRLIPGLW